MSNGEIKINTAEIEKKLEKGLFYTKMHTSFDELDPLNMLHNSRYSYILERATYLFFNAVGVIEGFDIVKYPDLHHVVHGIELTYHKPMFGVVPFFVSIVPEKLREAGVTFKVAFLSEDRKTIYCSGRRTIAKVKPETFNPVGWTPKFRETLDFIINLQKKLKNEK